MQEKLVCVVAALAIATAGDAWAKDGSATGPIILVGSYCPPGLAKKNPPCIPPGQAKKLDVHTDTGTAPVVVHAPDSVVIEETHDAAILEPGTVITGDYGIVTDPFYYGLDPAHEYYRVGDMFYRVDPATGEVLAFVGALSDLLD